MLTEARSVAFLPDGSLVVGSPTALVRIDPATEHETLIASGSYNRALAVEADGTILASGNNGLFRVNPVTGVAVLFVPVTVEFNPSCLGVTSSGQIFASDDGLDGGGGVFSIDPVTGVYSPIPGDFWDIGVCLTVDRNDQIIVTGSVLNRMWSVDPSSFVATPVPFGSQFISHYKVAAAETGLLYLGANLSGEGFGIAELDPVTGSESLILNLVPEATVWGLAVAPAQPVGANPIPALSGWGVVALAMLLVLIAVRGLAARRSLPPA